MLLEDVSNLLANNMFEKDIGPSQVLEDILALSRRCGTLIAVTISGLSEEGYEGETAGYIRALNEVNGKWPRLVAAWRRCAAAGRSGAKEGAMLLLESIGVAVSTYSVIPVPQFPWTERNTRYAIAAFP